MYRSGFLIFLKTPNKALGNYFIESIIFNNSKVEELCVKNHWNFHRVLLIQLKIGLFYHDLGLIKKSLKRLKNEYEFDIKAIEITLDFISSRFANQKDFKENHNFFSILVNILTKFTIEALNSRIRQDLRVSLTNPLTIHLNQLQKYCFPRSLLKDINELAQMLYIFRHLQNSIFEHLKYSQSFIDLSKFKSSLKSFELSKSSPRNTPINLNRKLIQGKTPTCVLNICKLLDFSTETQAQPLEKLKLYGINLVYRLICHEKLENPLVFTIIRNLGMHVNEVLRQIAFSTIRRDVREALLAHLEHVGRIQEKEKENIEFLRKIERFLPNPLYSSAKQRSWQLNLRKNIKLSHTDKDNSQIQANLFALPASRADFKPFLKPRPKYFSDLLKSLQNPKKTLSTVHENFKTFGCDLDDFKETSSFLKMDFFHAMESFHESIFSNRFTNLSDYNLPFNEKPFPEDSFSCSSSGETRAFVHCAKCKLAKTAEFGLLCRENDGYFQACLHWTRDWPARNRQRVLLELGAVQENELELLVLLDFYLQNHDWVSLKRILESVETSQRPAIVAYFEETLSKTTEFLRESLQNFFAQRYDVFFEDERATSLKKLQRIAKIGCLFPSTSFISSARRPTFSQVLNETRGKVQETGGLDQQLHDNFMQFLVDRGYLLILDEYIRFHGLALQSDSLTNLKKSPPSYLFLLPRDQLFELGMRNAEWLTGARTINEILLEKRVFRALGILMYAQVQSFENAYNSPETTFFLDKALFVENIREFPDLKAVVQEQEFAEAEIQTMLELGELCSTEKDMSLTELIDENPYFLYAKLLKELESSASQPRSPAAFVLQAVFLEDFMYFLYVSRPFQSFCALLRGVEVKDWAKSLRNLLEEKEKARDIYRKTFTIALNKPFSKSCTASCVVFLELLGFDSRLFKVDLEVSRRILLHLSLRNAEKTPSNSELFEILFGNCAKPCIKKSVLQPIIELFLNVPLLQSLELVGTSDAPIHSPELLTLLRLLEDATREMESLQYFHKEKNKVASPWQLVSSFCQFHNLPRSLTLLHELARNNEWIMLLYEAYSQKCPIDTLQDIIEKYLYEGPLQKHLLNMISSLNKKPQVLYWDLEVLNTGSFPSLFEDLLRCQEKSYRGIVLKLHSLVNHLVIREKISASDLHQSVVNLAIELKKPYFVILAYAISNSSNKMQGFAIVLSLVGQQILEVCEREAVLDAPNARNSKKFTEELRNSLRFLTNYREIDAKKLVIVLCLLRKHQQITTLLKLFFPKSKLLLFLRFWHKFCKRDYEHAFGKLALFLQRAEETPSEDNEFLLDKAPNLFEIVHTLLTRICEEPGFLSNYDLGKLLEILYYLEFDEKFADFYITYVFLEKIKETHPEIVQYYSLTYCADPLKVYQCLIEISLISEAKAFANYHEISENYAIIGEIVLKFLEIQQSGLLEGLDSEISLVFSMIIEKFAISSQNLAFHWIYRLSQSPLFSRKQQAFALFFSGCLAQKLDKFAQKLMKIKFQLFFVLYSQSLDVFSTNKRKGFKDFDFDLAFARDFRAIISEMDESSEQTSVNFKEIDVFTETRATSFALNRLDVDFIQYFTAFRGKRLALLRLPAVEIHDLMDQILQNEDFWELDYENILYLLRNPQIHLNMYAERLKGLLTAPYFLDFKAFAKAIFLLSQLLKKLRLKLAVFSVFELVHAINRVSLGDFFAILMDEGQNLLIKRYFKLIGLDPRAQIPIMLSYFQGNLAENGENLWTFHQFIDFVEITSQPALLAKTLINFLENNALDFFEKTQFFACLYFSAILSCRLEFLRRAFSLLKDVIFEALQRHNCQALEFFFVTIMDFEFLNEVFADLPEKHSANLKRMLEQILPCLEAFHLPLIKKFEDQRLLLKFLRNKRINRKLGNFFYKKARSAFQALAKEKGFPSRERNTRDFKEIFESLKGKPLNIRDREKLLVVWESLNQGKEFYLREEVYEKAHECLQGIRVVYELMSDICQ